MDNQTLYTNIRSKYLNLLTEYRQAENHLCEKILLRERQLQRLETKRKKLNQTRPHWIELLLKPVVVALTRSFPDWELDSNRFTPMGLASRVSVFFIKKGTADNDDKFLNKNSIYLSFLPGELSTGELLYETGETTSRYQPGTIGEINGFNQLSKPVESIEELIDFLNRQIAETNTES